MEPDDPGVPVGTGHGYFCAHVEQLHLSSASESLTPSQALPRLHPVVSTAEITEAPLFPLALLVGSTFSVLVISLVDLDSYVSRLGLSRDS